MRNEALNALAGSTDNAITDEVHLEAIDFTDGPGDLTYTLDSIPAGGTLRSWSASKNDAGRMSVMRTNMSSYAQ